MDRLTILNEYLAQDPNDDFVLYAIALEYQRLNKLDEAITQLELLKHKNEIYLPLYYTLGKIYEEAQQIDKAIIAYRAGKTIAIAQKNKKILGELNEALLILDALDDE